jgi:hypothetical protein
MIEWKVIPVKDVTDMKRIVVIPVMNFCNMNIWYAWKKIDIAIIKKMR